MTKILISYRRSDTAGVSGRLFDRLAAKYGEKSVFIDVDNIPFGIDFRDHIRTALSESDVMLAVMGTGWLGPLEEGKSRIKNESDPVRVEIEAALKAGIPLIPVLIDQARMPGPDDLPSTMQDFAYRNAANVSQGRDFGMHVDRLIRTIDSILESKVKPPPQPSPEAVTNLEPVKTPLAEPDGAVKAPPPPSVAATAAVPAAPRPVAQPVSSPSPSAVPTPVSGRFGWVRGPQDFVGGIALMAIALFALWASSDLQGMHGFSFGAGTAPRMFAGLLLGLGAAIALMGILVEGQHLAKYHWRGPLFVSLSILSFAVTIRPLGLIVASMASFMIAALGTPETRWKETIIVGILLTAFCSFLFPVVLGLPLQLKPQFMIH